MRPPRSLKSNNTENQTKDAGEIRDKEADISEDHNSCTNKQLFRG